MKAQYTPIVGLDFINAFGVRMFTFTLNRPNPAKGGRLETVGIVEMDNNATVYRVRTIDALDNRHAAIVRLAKRYMARSIPAVFSSMN
jgi:hypothetical protein